MSKEAKKTAIAAGLFLLFVGIIVFWPAYDVTSEYQTLWGKLKRSLSKEEMQRYHLFLFMEILGGISIAGGFICLFYGVSLKGEPIHPLSSYSFERGKKYCSNCGNLVREDDLYCSRCGHKLSG